MNVGERIKLRRKEIRKRGYRKGRSRGTKEDF